MDYRRFFLIACSLASVAASHRLGSATATIATSEIRLPVSGGAIRAELFEGPEMRPRPVLLVLHGAGGTLLDRPEMR